MKYELIHFPFILIIVLTLLKFLIISIQFHIHYQQDISFILFLYLIYKVIILNY